MADCRRYIYIILPSHHLPLETVLRHSAWKKYVNFANSRNERIFDYLFTFKCQNNHSLPCLQLIYYIDHQTNRNHSDAIASPFIWFARLPTECKSGHMTMNQLVYRCTRQTTVVPVEQGLDRSKPAGTCRSVAAPALCPQPVYVVVHPQAGKGGSPGEFG